MHLSPVAPATTLRSAPSRPSRPSVPSRSFVAVLVAVVVVLAWASAAGAHAALLSMSPEPDAVLEQAPTEVVLTFNEPVSIAADAVRVFAPSGEELRGIEAEAQDSTIRAELPPLEQDGSYTVAWRMVSADGHALSGAYLFHLREATLTEPVDAASAGVATWPGVVKAVGAVLALAGLVWVLGAAAAGSTAVGSSAAGPDRRSLRRAWATVLVGAVVTAVGAIGAVGGSLGDGVEVSLSTSTGKAVAVALALAVLGVALSWTKVSQRVLQVLAVAGVVTVALEGHAVALEPVARSASLTIVHVLAAVTWATGLFWLERRTRSDDAAQVRRDVQRLSPWALGAVVLLAATGAILVLDRVPLDELLSSWYGRLGVAKVGVLGLAIMFAVRNRFVLAARLEVDEGAGEVDEVGEVGDAEAEVAVLRSSVRVEMVVLAVALVLGAALAQIAPPSEGGSNGGDFAQEAPFGDGKVTLTVEPGSRGTNEVHVTTLGTDGRLMGDVTELQLSLSLPEEDIGPLQPEMLPVVPGHSVSYARFPFEGEWTVLVTAKIGKFEALSATFTVPIGP